MITLNPADRTPPFEQIRLQLRAQIMDGRLPAGTRLSTVRALARDLGVAVNTVARAYRELESEDLVVTRSRAGTVVAYKPSDSAPSDDPSEIVSSFLRAMSTLGYSEVDALTVLQEAVLKRF